jgi:hypothetical protein
MIISARERILLCKELPNYDLVAGYSVQMNFQTPSSPAAEKAAREKCFGH